MARKRRNIKVAEATLRMIYRLSKDVDWDSEVEISSLIEIARLSKQGLEALTVEG